MGERTEQRLFVWQRRTAMLLAPLIVVHVVTIFVAVNGGLSAAEILGRTRGSWWWGGFYSLFVLLVAVHAPIGIASVLRQTTALGEGVRFAIALLFALLLLGLGLRAVMAVVT